MTFTHIEKKKGDLIKSEEWNVMGKETMRLESDKVDRKGDTVNGPLTVTGNVGIGTKAPNIQLAIGDSDTGLKQQGDGKLAIYTNNVERVRVDNAGNVGIGTTAPKRKLDITSGGQITFGNDVRPDNESGIFWNHDTNYAIYKESGSWQKPFPALRIAFATGIKIGGSFAEGGTRFYNNSDMKTEIFSVGKGDNHVRAKNNLIVDGNVGIGTTSPSAQLHATLGGQFNKIAVGCNVYGKTKYPYETIQLSSTHNLRFCFGINEKVRFNNNGLISAKSTSIDGLDYAEHFKSLSGEAIETGVAVVLEKDKIRPARKGEIPMGIISSGQGVLGGVPMEWPRKYLRDEFGRVIMDEVKKEIMEPGKKQVTKERQKVERKTVEEETTRTEILKLKSGKYIQKEIVEKVKREIDEPVFEEVDLYNASGRKVIGRHQAPVMESYEVEEEVLDRDGNPVMVGTGRFEIEQVPRLNPAYDPEKEYIPRENRPEWNCVGLLGQLPMKKGQPTAPTWIKMKDINEKIEMWLIK